LVFNERCNSMKSRNPHPSLSLLLPVRRGAGAAPQSKGRLFGVIALLLVALSSLASCGQKTALARAPTPIADLRSVCKANKVPYPPKHVFLRAFKQERELELWARSTSGEMKLIRTYPIAAASGEPGPKRREADLQVPEGVYRVDLFNPNSRFHLSMRINYPNQADRILSDPVKPGGDIYIHGNQVSTGCLAMTDLKIDEIYPTVRGAKHPIPAHIFPCRFKSPVYAALKQSYPQHVSFWHDLEPIYSAFERTHRVPDVSVSRKGRYVLKSPR
jgi:murein L,D-transpeptidase YafK